MSRLNAITVVLDAAKGSRQQIVAQMHSAQRLCAGARGQLEQLDSYAKETRDKWALASRQTTTTELLRHYNQFMQRLQQALELQQQAVARQELALAAQHTVLVQIDVRIAGLERLLAKRQLAAGRLVLAREQHQMDEFAAQQVRRRMTTSASSGAP